MYINFIDFSKAFDCMGQYGILTSLLGLLRHNTIRAQAASQRVEGILQAAGSKRRVVCGMVVCCLASSLS